MKKIEKKKITTNCDCSEDCSYNQFSISQQENIIFERLAPRVYDFKWAGIYADTQYGHFGTNAMDGLDFDETYWFNMGNDNLIKSLGTLARKLESNFFLSQASVINQKKRIEKWNQKIVDFKSVSGPSLKLFHFL